MVGYTYLVQFSGKISNSILVYLSRFGWDREKLYEITEIPLEFLGDPTCWLPAEALEKFLCSVEKEFAGTRPRLIAEAGLAGNELRGWGVLDSVLRMMQKPQDIYAQPQRFLSYFISPAPPILNLKNLEEGVSFDLPIAHTEYPATVAYLSAALEGLPLYWGQEAAQVHWRNSTLSISWSEAQSQLLHESIHNPRPELMDNLVRGVEMAQAQVEAKDLEIARLEQEIRELRVQMAKKQHLGSQSVASDFALSSDERAQLQSQLGGIRENVLRLSDYLVRCQQALTLARSALKRDPQVQALLKRIDWDSIRAQFPWLHLKIIEGLNSAENVLMPSINAHEQQLRGKVDIGEVLENVLDRLTVGQRHDLNLKSQSFVGDKIEIDPDQLHVALWEVLLAGANEAGENGSMDIMARLEDGALEFAVGIETDQPPRRELDLPLLNPELEMETTYARAADFVHQHGGKLRSHGQRGQSRQFILRWPLSQKGNFSYDEHSKHSSS